LTKTPAEDICSQKSSLDRFTLI